MKLQDVRNQSVSIAKDLGYQPSLSLPLLDWGQLRSTKELTDRILCLNAVAAAAWGLPAAKAQEWIVNQDLYGALALSEREALRSQEGLEHLRLRVEALYALLWCGSLIGDLDFVRDCPDTMVRLLPDLRKGRDSHAFRTSIKLRDHETIYAKCDLAYCLHWCARDAALHGTNAGTIGVLRLAERRRALEWILSRDDWDQVRLDT